jgi:hypothetical protein
MCGRVYESFLGGGALFEGEGAPFGNEGLGSKFHCRLFKGLFKKRNIDLLTPTEKCKSDRLYI